MGWEDRHYYRDRSFSAGNPLVWLLTGSVPLFTVFGVRVRAHASLLLVAFLGLLLGFGPDFGWQNKITGVAILFAVVLLHEFGHVFAARGVGGEADEIIMHPLGGLALANPPRRPLPTFLTVAAGPAVNVVICGLCASVLYLTIGRVPWNPFVLGAAAFNGWLDVAFYAYWVYQISWMLLIFNLLPVYPLDGGQMVQSALWARYGYYRATVFACITGMVGAVIMFMVGVAWRQPLLAMVAVMGFVNCFSLHRQLKAAGPWAFEGEETTDFSASLEKPAAAKRRRLSRWAVRRARKILAQEHAEQGQIDAILAKVSAHGMRSLTWRERRCLRKATERQRQSEVELSKVRLG